MELEFRFQHFCAGSRQVALVFGKRGAWRCRSNRCSFVSIGAKTAVFWSFDRHFNAKRPENVEFCLARWIASFARNDSTVPGEMKRASGCVSGSANKSRKLD